jgi:thioredoxin-like negative regulator of GroEL
MTMQVVSPNTTLTTLQKNGPSLLFVGVSWCGHCTRARPILEKVATAMGTVVPVKYIDADKAPKLAKQLSVSSFPTLILIDGQGKVLQPYEGPRTTDHILNYVCNGVGAGSYGFCTRLI